MVMKTDTFKPYNISLKKNFVLYNITLDNIEKRLINIRTNVTKTTKIANVNESMKNIN